MSEDGSAYIYLVSEDGNGEIYRFVGRARHGAVWRGAARRGGSMGGGKRGGLSINSFQL